MINNLMDSLGGDEKMQFHACYKVGHPPLYVTFPVRPSVCLSVAHHVSGTVRHPIIIFGAHV